MSEPEDFLNRVERKANRKVNGSGLTPFGVKRYTPEQEEAILSLPVFTKYQQPLQDPATGEFLPMVGIDGTPADPLGRT